MKSRIKRTIVVVVAVLALAGLVAPLLGRGSAANQAQAQESQTATVQRGDLRLDVTASGNLALSRKEDVAFEVSSTEGDPLTVQEVLVDPGDAVKKGDVLVRLDVTSLSKAVQNAERTYRDEQINVEQQQLSMKDQEAALKAAQMDLVRARQQVEQAAPNVSNSFTYYTDMPTVAVNIAQAQAAIDEALALIAEGAAQSASARLALAKDYLNMAGSAAGRTIFIAVDKQKPVAEALASMQTLLYQLEKTQDGVARAQLAMEKARLAMEKARMALDRDKETLDEANDRLKKAVVVAPFDGFVSAVNVKGGDEVRRGTVAVQVADPNRFEATIMVSEMDIAQVKLGGEATFRFDSAGGMSLPGKVAHISPTATIQSGIVNYKVRVEVSADVLQRDAGATAGQQPPGTKEGFRLRDGLTVTVNIMTQQKAGVLLVPNAAITTEGGQRYVQVISPAGTVERRAVKTGITDYRVTEIMEGLTEGERIGVPKSTTSGSSSQQRTASPGAMMIPGLGAPPSPPPGGAPR